MNKNLANRLKTHYGPYALVTGASSGIGKAIAAELAKAGLNLILIARSEKILDDLASKLKSEHGIHVSVIPLDLSTKDSFSKLIAQTKDFDIGLFVAAAGFGTSGSFSDIPLEKETDMLLTNCYAVLEQTKYFTQRFENRSRSGIILFGSIVGFQGAPRASNYAATKAYIQTLAEALHVELKSTGIDVLSAAPGPVNSSFAGRAKMQMGNALKPQDIAVPILKALGKRQTVRPGFLSKLISYSMLTVPRWLRIRIMAVVMRGMTKTQSA